MNSIQIASSSTIDPDVYRVLVMIFVIVLVMRFILSMLQKVLTHKLKNKIIDKEIAEDLASSILQTDSINEKHATVKWFAILLVTGIGLFIANQYLPLGIHSIAIMTISIAMGFLAYLLYLKYFDN